MARYSPSSRKPDVVALGSFGWGEGRDAVAYGEAGPSLGRLATKLAAIDRRQVLVGSQELLQAFASSHRRRKQPYGANTSTVQSTKARSLALGCRLDG